MTFRAQAINTVNGTMALLLLIREARNGSDFPNLLEFRWDGAQRCERSSSSFARSLRGAVAAFMKRMSEHPMVWQLPQSKE
jgi:hypothetical protein